METLKPYIGSYMDTAVFLNHGKYGFYLNHNKRLYSVPQCFQKLTFKLDDAIKIIEYKQKTQKQEHEQEEEDIIKKLDREPKGASSDFVGPGPTRAGSGARAPMRGLPSDGGSRRGSGSSRGVEASRRDSGSRSCVEDSRRVEIGVAGRTGCAQESASRRARGPRPERSESEAEDGRRGRRRECVAAG